MKQHNQEIKVKLLYFRHIKMRITWRLFYGRSENVAFREMDPVVKIPVYVSVKSFELLSAGSFARKSVPLQMKMNIQFSGRPRSQLWRCDFCAGYTRFETLHRSQYTAMSFRGFVHFFQANTGFGKVPCHRYGGNLSFLVCVCEMFRNSLPNFRRLACDAVAEIGQKSSLIFPVHCA